MSNLFYHERYCLTKAQEEIIKPLLPAPKATGRPALNPLIVFNAILWIMSSGAAWRDLPPHFGNWNSIYHKFRLWCDNDVFENILKVLVADTEKYLLVQIDSTFCKVHQHAAGARKQGGTVCIPDKANSRTLHEFDRDLYKARNVVERFFLRIKNRRRIATRYDKLTVCFLNFILLSAIMLQL